MRTNKVATRVKVVDGRLLMALRDNAHEAFVTVGKGTIKIEKLILQLIACIIVYVECALQAAFFFVLAFVSGILRVKGYEKNWERFYTFATPMPRLLMHSVPGIPNTKKVVTKTSKILGNSCDVSGFVLLDSCLDRTFRNGKSERLRNE